MVYAEKILGREIRWEDLPPRSGVGAHGGLLRTKKRKIDYGAQQTSLGARPRLEPSPPTSPTTRLVTFPNQHAGQELSRLPLSNLVVRERQINFVANVANVPPTNLTNPVAETSSRLVEEQLTNERAIFESKLHDLEEKAARLETEKESLVRRNAELEEWQERAQRQQRVEDWFSAHMYATLKDTLKANVILQKCNGDVREGVASGILIPRDPHSMFKDSWTTTIDLGDGEKKTVVDWNKVPQVKFQYDTAKVGDTENLKWPNVPTWVKDGEKCTMC